MPYLRIHIPCLALTLDAPLETGHVFLFESQLWFNPPFLDSGGKNGRNVFKFEIKYLSVLQRSPF